MKAPGFARLKKRWPLSLLAIALPLSLFALAVSDWKEIDSRTRDLSLDSYTRIQPFLGDPDMARSMVFVDIDEASLARFGQWPWPRQYMAVMLQNIGLAGPLAIGVDILMSEDDRFNASAIERLGDFAEGELEGRIADGDALLGDMLARTPSILAVSLTSAESANPPYLPASVSVIGDSRPPLMQGSGLLSPVEKLATAPGAGFVSLAVERDSTVRHVPMVAHFGDQMVPSMAAEMLRVAQGAGGHILKQAVDTGTAVNRMRTGQITLALDNHGRLPLWHGSVDRFPVISAIDVIEQTGMDRLTDAFVIVGSSATGLKDTHSTSLEAAVAGPLIHLAALHQILSGVTLQSSRLYEFGEFAAAAGLAIFLGLMAAHAPIPAALAALLLGTAGTAYGSFRMFTDQMLLSNAILSTSIVLATGALCMMLRGIADERSRRKLRSAFGQYLSPQMVQRIEKSGVSPELGGVTSEITVMFMDVRGFTTLSEQLSATPQVLTRLINIILDEASEIVLAHGGTVDKFIGDCVMAFWNAPMPQQDHHDRAVAAGIALQNHVPAINARIAAEIGDAWQGDGIAIGVGMASGKVVVGNFGSRARLSYSVVGDTVNLAARLEPFSKQSGLSLTFAAATAEGATAHQLLKMDEIAVRGRQAAEAIYSWHPLDADVKAAHDAFLTRLLAAEGAKAKPALTRALKPLAAHPDYPQGLADYYRRRIAAL